MNNTIIKLLKLYLAIDIKIIYIKTESLGDNFKVITEHSFERIDKEGKTLSFFDPKDSKDNIYNPKTEKEAIGFFTYNLARCRIGELS